MRTKFLVYLLATSQLFSGSLRLYNNSPFKLRAVIRGADGSYLGEMIVLPEHFNTWSSQYPSFGPGGQQYQPSPNRTLTPYTVHWFCPDGDEFGLSSNAASGAAVLAEQASGPRFCKPPKKKKNNRAPYGPHEDDEQLHQQNEAQEDS